MTKIISLPDSLVVHVPFKLCAPYESLGCANCYEINLENIGLEREPSEEALYMERLENEASRFFTRVLYTQKHGLIVSAILSSTRLESWSQVAQLTNILVNNYGQPRKKTGLFAEMALPVESKDPGLVKWSGESGELEWEVESEVKLIMGVGGSQNGGGLLIWLTIAVAE